MALSRNFLSALGIEEAKIEEIVKANYESISGLKDERDQAKGEIEKLKAENATYKKDAEKAAGLQKELDELRAASEKNNSDSWKVKYEALKEDHEKLMEERDKLRGEFDEFKTATSAEKVKNAKEKAYGALLKAAGITNEKRISAILKVTDFDNLELDEDGNFKDEADINKQIRTDWEGMIPVESEAGANTPKPPTNNGGMTKTKDDIMAIPDREERQRAIAENPKLFGIE